MKNRMSRQMGICIAVFFGVLGILWLFLVGAGAIPNEAIKSHMEQSALSFQDKEAFSFEDGLKWSGISDHYADAILLNISWNMGRGRPFYHTLDTWYYDGESLGEHAGFFLAVTGEVTEPNQDYTRYWHGSAIGVRLFHLFTDIDGMRNLMFGWIMAEALVTLMILIKGRHYDIGLALLWSMAAVEIRNVSLSLEYEPVFVLCFFLCPLFLGLERKGDEILAYLCVAGGVMTAFFDFLTAETVTVLVPLILVTAVRAREGRLRDFRAEIPVLFWLGVCWVLAYGGTFLVKWTAASLVTGENKFLMAFSSVGERMGGNLPGNVPESFFSRIFLAVAANLTVLLGGRSRVELSRAAGGILGAVLLLGSVYYLFRKEKGDSCGVKLLAVLGSVVFLRYMVLSNHSYLHEFFTYRALMAPVLAVWCGLFLSIELPKRKRNSGVLGGRKGGAGRR